MKKCGAKWGKFYLIKIGYMLNLYSKLRRIQGEKNEKWVGEEIGYILDISRLWLVRFQEKG